MIINSRMVNLYFVAFCDTMLDLNFSSLDRSSWYHPYFLFWIDDGRYFLGLSSGWKNIGWRWRGGRGLLLRLHVVVHVLWLSFCCFCRQHRIFGIRNHFGRIWYVGRNATFPFFYCSCSLSGVSAISVTDLFRFLFWIYLNCYVLDEWLGLEVASTSGLDSCIPGDPMK